ncbi:1-acyl-sn-glycerol-3-phosphate acyltransferase BAT2, chloroplastic [Lycium ferocissimum]|uniref:1-acyl-sn-glycerol-3-phosphate acyltransferase BAT2, chloroplastic n=1 Tax=Lycium ferocissimum TaxID=112874 RepID=UPI002814E39E|nr:1-acyl-sn-glycerol-3-phosphate acyltransferase BAT2, chloroplastic [Lycium ferocissimum]
MEISFYHSKFNNFHLLQSWKKQGKLPLLPSPHPQLTASRGNYSCCSSLRQSIWRNTKLYAVPGCTTLGTSRQACVSLHSFSQEKKYNTGYGNNSFYRQYRSLRRIIARSELANTSSAGAAYPLSDLELRSKVRAIGFYTVTALSSIFLFLLMLVQHPFVLLFDRYRRRAHHLVAKTWATLTITPFYSVEFEGLENLPSPDTPAVYVSNHQSFLDIYTLLTLGRSFKFISKTAIFLFPIIGWAMYLMGLIPLRRMDSRSQLECLKRCIDLIKKGASVFFFPEGTRSKDGKLGPFKKGAFSVAAKTGVPLVPITITGTGRIMPAGLEGRVYPGLVKVVVHRPLKGNDSDVLCSEARNVIKDVLVHQG